MRKTCFFLSSLFFLLSLSSLSLSSFLEFTRLICYVSNFIMIKLSNLTQNRFYHWFYRWLPCFTTFSHLRTFTYRFRCFLSAIAAPAPDFLRQRSMEEIGAEDQEPIATCHAQMPRSRKHRVHITCEPSPPKSAAWQLWDLPISRKEKHVLTNQKKKPQIHCHSVHGLDTHTHTLTTYIYI